MNTFKWFFIMVSGSMLVLSFQNCGGDMSPLQSAINSQYSSSSSQGASIPLPNIDSLLKSSNIIFWDKNTVTSVSKSTVFSDVNSVVMAIDSTVQGTIYSFNAGINNEESRISVSNGIVRVSHITDANNYLYLDGTIPIGISGKILIAASFGTGAADLVLLINGTLQQGTAVKVGAPVAYNYLQRTWTAASVNNIAQMGIYAEALSALNLNTLSRYIATDSSVANVVYDPAVGGNLTLPTTTTGSTTTSDSAQFLAAKAIIDANCLGCHSSSANGNFSNLTQDQFVQKGYVVASSPSTSPIYYKLKGAASGGTMPQGGSALSASQIKTISDWINSIK